jgi:GT2 family glycosyltransferase
VTSPPTDSPLEEGISLLIPVHGGREDLAVALESAEVALKKTGRPYEMIVVNNNSPDDTAQWVATNKPQVRLLNMADNAYLKNLNTGMRTCRYRILALLNNDMKVEEDYLLHLLPHFEDPNLFAVTNCVMEWQGDRVQGHRRIYRFNRGWFWYLPAEDADPKKYHGHATGGQSVFDLAKIAELGYNDELLRPLYHEDLDLTYRAYKAGYHARYEPAAVVYHRGGATSKRVYKPLQLESIKAKNLFLFQWKNLHDPGLLFQHLLFLPMRLLMALLKGDRALLLGFFKALRQLPEIPARRRAAKAQATRTDAEVFEMLKG